MSKNNNTSLTRLRHQHHHKRNVKCKKCIDRIETRQKSMAAGHNKLIPAARYHFMRTCPLIRSMRRVFRYDHPVHDKRPHIPVPSSPAQVSSVLALQDRSPHCMPPARPDQLKRRIKPNQNSGALECAGHDDKQGVVGRKKTRRIATDAGRPNVQKHSSSR